MLDRGSIAQQQYDEIVAVIRAELAYLDRPAAPAPAKAPQDAPPTGADDLVVIDAEIVELPTAPPTPPGKAALPTPVAPPVQAPPKAVHPLDRPYVPPPAPPKPVVPRRSLAEVVQSFMEESNIRWMEIIAAVCIVISSVGLVWSVRSTLKSVPFVPASLFMLFTLAFHGAGLYTLRKWKLHAISRVILVIALLLVPLSFAGAVVMSGSGDELRSVIDPVFLIVLTAGLVVFGWISYSGTRELIGGGAEALAVGVLGCSASQVIIHRTEPATLGFWGLTALAALPLASYLTATVTQLIIARRWQRLSRHRVNQILLVLGIATFSLAAPLALLLVRSSRWQTIAQLSTTLSLAAAAVLALGLLIHRRTTARNLATYRTAGTAILVCAGIALLMLVAFTWPEPELLMIVGAINAAVLAALGVAAELPLLYLPALACAALSATIGVHLASGHFAEREHLAQKVVQAILMGRTSVILGVLGFGTGAAGLWSLRRRRSEDGLMLLSGTGGLAVAAVLISLFSGFVTVPQWPQDRDLAAAMLLLYAAGLLAAGSLAPEITVGKQQVGPLLSAAGSFLLWTALVQAAAANETVRGWLSSVAVVQERPVLLATVLHGVIAAAMAAAATYYSRRLASLVTSLAQPAAASATISLTALTPFLFWGGDLRTSAALAALAAVGWLLAAISQGWPAAVSAFQAMLALAPALWVAGVWRAQDGRRDWWLTQEHLLAQVMLGALAAIVWSAARRLTSEREPLRKMLSPPWPAVDQVLLGAATVILPLIAVLAVLPLAGWELGVDLFESAIRQSAAGDALGPLTRGWLALAVVAAALAVAMWERVTLPVAVGIGLAAYAAIWFGAAHFADVTAVASAARWCAAVYAAVFAVAFIARDPLRAGLKRLPWLRWSRFPAAAVYWFGAQPLVLGGLTVLLLTIVAVAQNASGVALRGPASNSVFAAIGPTISYAGPLIALVAILLGYAVRERRAEFALGGAAVFQFAINLAFVLYVSTTATQPAEVRLIEWLQWNSVAAGIFAIVWLGLSRWITPATATLGERRLSTALWLAPVGVGAAAAAALAIRSAFIIIAQPAMPPPEIVPLGHWLSYAAVGLILAAVVARFLRSSSATGYGDAVAWLLAAIVPLLAATLNQFDGLGRWFAYHTLEAGWLAVAAIACVAVCSRQWLGERLARIAPHHFSSTAIAALVVFLAIRGDLQDPGQPWWSLAGALGCAAIATTLGLARRSQPYAFAATALAGLAVLLFWSTRIAGRWVSVVMDDFYWFVAWETFFIALVAAAGFWLWREIDSQLRRVESLDARRFMPRVHAGVICGLVPLLFLWRLTYGLFSTWQGGRGLNFDIAAAVTTVVLGGLLAATLWDRRATWLGPLTFLFGGAAWCLAIGLLRFWLPLPECKLTALVLALAGQVALSGQIWSYGANLAAWGTKAGVPDPIGGLSRTAKWLPVVNLLLTCLGCLASLLLVLTLDTRKEILPFRVAAAFGPAIAAWGVACLAQERRREALQLTALLVAGFSAVLLGWSQIDGHTADLWMQRVFRLLMVLAALTFAYGLVLPRLLLTGGSWHAATRKAGYIAGSAAVAAFVVTLALEISLFVPGRGAAVGDVQVIAIAVVLVALIAGLVSMALLPGRDPLLLSERAKQAYVYAAEAVGALLFAHLYVCKPLWFDTVLRPYWPFIVMGLAFSGVGAAELFHRWKVRVLAEPLERTGALLPLLPVIGWWVAGSQVDYALLLLVAGILYLALSFTRKSWAAMVAAAVAGNGALWSLFSEKAFHFADHPQLWLIPPALSVLAAAQVNRHRLSAEALTAIRYAATIVIYVSSTSEIMLRGLGTDLRPPMILLGLSVAGALAGIALRVRAFLYLGAAFTLLALTSMVWHASRSIEHVWPLWAFGICLGVGLLVMLVLFEKNKAEMHQLVARLRKWEQ